MDFLGWTGLLLACGGLATGVLAALAGVGGGLLLVPLMVAVGLSPLEAVATSALVMTINALSGSIRNWRAGQLELPKVLAFGLPAVISAQFGVYLAGAAAQYLLLASFGGLLLLSIYLFELRGRLGAAPTPQAPPVHAVGAGTLWGGRISGGGLAGLMASLFGVGGGVVLVPLQVLLLHEPLKTAVRTSLGVVVITALAAFAGHALQGNLRLDIALLLGFGGMLGAQIGARWLGRMNANALRRLIQGLMGLLSLYVFWQAWHYFPR